MTWAELPAHVLAALRRRREEGCVAVVATVDEQGNPHTAPFGSIRAPSATTLRFGCDRGHDTYANLLRNPNVVANLLLPPDVAVSVSGRATVTREEMETVATDAVVEIEVIEVKDDMLAGAAIDSGVAYAVPAEVAGFIARYNAEVDEAGR